MSDIVDPQDQALLDKFLADNRLFLGPDPEIMRNHSIAPRTPREDALLSQPVDLHQINHVRGVILAALGETFTMVNQMGAAPGAKWGDLVTAIYTPTGDLSMIAPHGIVAFAAVCHYPIKFIIKNAGTLDHEFFLNSFEHNAEHKIEMQKNPEMVHDEPNAQRLAPGKQIEILWKFSKAGTFEFACLIPGHYEAGMHGKVVVK